MNNSIQSQLKNLPNINHADDKYLLSQRKRAYKEQRIAMLYISDITDDHDRQTVERITKEQLYGEKK